MSQSFTTTLEEENTLGNLAATLWKDQLPLCPSFPEHHDLNGGGVSLTSRSPGVAQQDRSTDVVERI
jgi:hypothetical protein